MKETLNIKNFIISQRLRYLALGAAVGFLIGLNRSPLREIMIIVLVVVALLLGIYYSKKNRH